LGEDGLHTDSEKDEDGIFDRKISPPLNSINDEKEDKVSLKKHESNSSLKKQKTRMARQQTRDSQKQRESTGKNSRIRESTPLGDLKTPLSGGHTTGNKILKMFG